MSVFDRLIRQRRRGVAPVKLPLFFLLHADGSVYQYWPRGGPSVRRIHEPALVEAVTAEYARLRDAYREKQLTQDQE